jgi:hypothetical protein
MWGCPLPRLGAASHGDSGQVAISRAVAGRRCRGQVRRVEENDVDVAHGRRVEAASFVSGPPALGWFIG